MWFKHRNVSPFGLLMSNAVVCPQRYSVSNLDRLRMTKTNGLDFTIFHMLNEMENILTILLKSSAGNHKFYFNTRFFHVWQWSLFSSIVTMLREERIEHVSIPFYPALSCTRCSIHWNCVYQKFFFLLNPIEQFNPKNKTKW